MELVNITELFSPEQFEVLADNAQQMGDILDLIRTSGNVGIVINAAGGRIENLTKSQRTFYQEQ